MIIDQNGIYLTKKQASVSAAILVVLALLLFVGGYFWGKQSVIDGFTQKTSQESFNDQVDYLLTMQSFAAKHGVLPDNQETEEKEDYKRVSTPHIARHTLFEISGHLPYYRDDMYAPMMIDEEEYFLKGMNCPHHHKLFGAVPRSYRDLPLRLAEYGTCYRYEQSGELFGLMRVRSLNMNDAHIYCTEEQFADEFRAVNDMYLKYFKIFGVDRYQFRFSTHSPEELGKKYVDQSELWLKTGWTMPTVPVVTCDSDAHRDQACPRHQMRVIKRRVDLR